MMNSSRSSWAWMYPFAAIVWSIHSSMLIKTPERVLDSRAASSSSAEAPADSRSLFIKSVIELDLCLLGGLTTGIIGLILGSILILEPLSSLPSTTWAIGAWNSSSQSQQMKEKSEVPSMMLLPLGSISSPQWGQAWRQRTGAIFLLKSTMSWGVPSSSSISWSLAASSPLVSSWSLSFDLCSSLDSSSKLFSSLTISSMVFPRRFMTSFWFLKASTLASLSCSFFSWSSA